ncbi:MAG: hypothetical protein KKB59_18885 [Spirochaetes bacterium]|nr:hypothetical protein [Spirochaetota bacterium]
MAELTLSPTCNLKLICTFFEKDLAKSIKGFKSIRDTFNKHLYWEYPLDQVNVKALQLAFPNLRVDDYIEQALIQKQQKIEKLLEIKKMTDCEMHVPLKTQPYPHQRVGIKFMLEVLTK